MLRHSLTKTSALNTVISSRCRWGLTLDPGRNRESDPTFERTSNPTATLTAGFGFLKAPAPDGGRRSGRKPKPHGRRLSRGAPPGALRRPTAGADGDADAGDARKLRRRMLPTPACTVADKHHNRITSMNVRVGSATFSAFKGSERAGRMIPFHQL
jgi:hypothetical protein